jgi:hypothetical protein
MANDIVIHQFHGAVVGQKNESGYINATSMATAHRFATGKRKDVADWLRLDRTQETLTHLSSITGIPVIELYQAFQGAPESGGGTWIHPRLAIRFGMWLSDDFGLAVEDWVKGWQAQPTAIASSPSKELIAAREIRELTDLLDDNPRLAQVLTDSIINRVVELPQLPGTAQPLRGVAEIAVELGFKVDASNRVKLGNYIKAQGFDSEKEKRLCNGVMTGINCYRDTPELREAIAGYFQ